MASTSLNTQARYEKSIATGSFFKEEHYLKLCGNDEYAKRLAEGCRNLKLSLFLNPPITDICYESLISFWDSAKFIPGPLAEEGDKFEDDKIVASVNGKEVEITEKVIRKHLKLPNKGPSKLTLVPQDLNDFWATIAKPENAGSTKVNCLRSTLKTSFNEFSALIGKTIEGKLGANNAMTETRMRLMGVIYNKLEFNWAKYFFLRLKEQIQAEIKAGEKGAKERKVKKGHFWVKKSYGIQLHYLLQSLKVPIVQLHKLHESKVMFTYVKQQKKAGGGKRKTTTRHPARQQKKQRVQRNLDKTDFGSLVDEEDEEEDSAAEAEQEEEEHADEDVQHPNEEDTGDDEESPEETAHLSAIDIDDRIAEYLEWKEGDSRQQLKNPDRMLAEEAWLFNFLGIKTLVGVLDESNLWDMVEAAKAKLPQTSDKQSDDSEDSGDDQDDDDDHDEDDDDNHHDDEGDEDREEDDTPPDPIDDATLLSTFLHPQAATNSTPPAKTATPPLSIDTSAANTIVVDTGSAAGTPAKTTPGTEKGGTAAKDTPAYTSTQILENVEIGGMSLSNKTKASKQNLNPLSKGTTFLS